MVQNKSLNRRDVIGGAAALAASTAMIPGTSLAQSDGNAADAFYEQGQYTYCDAKVLARYWAASPSVNNEWEAKVLAGQKILGGQLQFLKRELTAAGEAWDQAGQSCAYSDVDNPNYTRNDLNALKQYWNSKGGNYESASDVKSKILLNVVGGGNPWVRLELENARQ